MSPPLFDVAVLGSGFAGSLIAMILQTVGRRVALIDKSRHPRFAIGESSTPIANIVLRGLVKQYDLPRLLPITRHGTWQDAYPDVGCGLKRGFSYFAHTAGQTFRPVPTHENELLVAASSHDRDSDTQWLRADVDWLFCVEAARLGVTVLEDCDVLEVQHLGRGGWSLSCQRGEQELTLRTEFIIDGTGEAAVLPRAIGIKSCAERCRTRSRAIFSHFRGVHSWHDHLRALGAQTQDHPFHCDDAAQHHILDGAWLWMLRFNTGVTSAGLVLDGAKHPLDPSLPAADEWQQWLDRYPSLADMFSESQLASVPGELIRTRRLQRRWTRVADQDWALLPHTAGFIDPLHSTGIAQSMCGIERLVQILDREWHAESRTASLLGYEGVVMKELELIDQLVAICFENLNSFEAFVVASMMYFAAATTDERLRCSGECSPGFLCSDRAEVRQRLLTTCDRVSQLMSVPGPVDMDRIRREVTSLIAPINHVGLLEPANANMYHHTVAPQ